MNNWLAGEFETAHRDEQRVRDATLGHATKLARSEKPFHPTRNFINVLKGLVWFSCSNAKRLALINVAPKKSANSTLFPREKPHATRLMVAPGQVLVREATRLFYEGNG